MKFRHRLNRAVQRPLGLRPAMAAALAGAALLANLAQAQDATPPTPTPTPEPVTVRAVAQFDFAQSRLRETDRNRLLADVATMKDVSWQTVTAIGHTDAVGAAAYNDRLALARATAVRDYLAQQGLPPTLLRVAAKGQTAPVADNASESGRARNRRTEVVFEGVRVARP